MRLIEKDIQDNLDITIEKWIELLKKYDFEEMMIKPASNSWSLSQLYLHLIFSTNFYLQRIGLCLKNKNHQDKQKLAAAIEMFKNNSFPNLKLHNPNFNDKQRPAKSMREIENGFEKIKQRLESLYVEIEKDIHSGKANHTGGLGYFTAIEWLQFADMHFRHHFKQYEEITNFLLNKRINREF